MIELIVMVIPIIAAVIVYCKLWRNATTGE